MKHILKKKHTKFLSFIIIMTIAIVGVLLLLELLNLFNITTAFIKLPKYKILVIILILNISIFLFYRLFIYNINLEYNLVHKKLKNISNDLQSLSIAISELSRGNLIIQAINTEEIIKGKNEHKENELINLYDQISSYIKESILDFNTITSVPCKRLIYIGADSFREGEKCGEIMGKLLNGNGRVAVLINKMTVVGQVLRYKGFKSILNKEYPNIEILGIWEEFEDVKETYRLSKELIKKYPGLSGIYITEGTTPVGAADAIKDQGKIEKIKIIAHDLTNPTMKNLESGLIKATLSQNPYTQGYEPIIYLYNYLINRKKPPTSRKLTLLEIVNNENYKKFWNNEQGALISEKTIQTLSVPEVNTLSKQLKIAVILTDDKLFWEPVAKGIKDATIKLKDHNVMVKCIIPEAIQSGGRNAELYIPVIDNLLNEGIDALSLPIFDRNLIPYLNDKIDNGLVVATFNSEPFNFRGIMDNVAKHAESLYKVSEDLATGSNESNYATTQINNTMKNILTGSKYQLEKLSESEKGIISLMENIDKIVLKTNESSQAAENTIKAAQIGHETVQKSRESIQELLKSSKTATDIINTLNGDTIKIQEIINIIEDISSQTSILAINASIQAAHAGEEGKGFSVVASEVKELAKKSTLATKNIQELIKTILLGIEKATKSISYSMAEVNKSVKISEKVEIALNDILRASGDNENKIRVIDLAVKEIKEIIDVFKKSMDSFVKLNRENSAAVEEITKSTNDMSQQIQDISNMANLLSDMSRVQDDLVAQFILEETKNKKI